MNNADISIIRGNSARQQWQFMVNDTTPLNLAGGDLVLVVKWRGGSLQRSTADGGLTMDAPNGVLTWSYTPAESRLLPAGRVTRYEIERREGDMQRTWVAGYVNARDAINDD